MPNEPTRIAGDLIVTGGLAVGSLTLPSSSVVNASVAAGADIDAAKFIHPIRVTEAQDNVAAADETRIIHVARRAGTVVSFRAGSIAIAVGNAIATVDLKKNGTTVLSAVITLDNANTNRVAEAGTINTAAYVAGDVFEWVVVDTIGTGTLPTGVFCHMEALEDPT